MYATVPIVDPGLVRWDSSIVKPWVIAAVIPLDGSVAGFTFAKPKSRILACPRLVRKILAGLMSR